jgi:hypothetical protein
MGKITSGFLTGHGWFWPFLLWMVQGVAIGLLTLVNPNSYTTVDSTYYLSAAENLYSGNGYAIEENGQLVWNGHFPPGYTILIVLLKYAGKTSFLISSKLVNWIASGVLLLFVRAKYNTEAAIAFGLYLCSGVALKIWVHTWSEPLFICILIIWCHYFLGKSQKKILKLFVLGSLLILVRYAGIFIIPIILLYGQTEKCHKARQNSWVLAALLTIVFVSILVINYAQSGELYGGDRFTNQTPFTENLYLFVIAFVNELLLIRDFGKNGLDALCTAGIILQAIWMFWMLRTGGQLRYNLKVAWRKVFPYFKIAISYLLFLFLVRLISPFDAPGFRLLAPFTFLMGAGLLYQSTEMNNPRKYVPWIVLILLSWMHLLPS